MIAGGARYLRSWFPVDVIVLLVDAALIMLQEIQNAQPEGTLPASKLAVLHALPFCARWIGWNGEGIFF